MSDIRRNEDDVHRGHEDHTLNKKKLTVSFVTSKDEKNIFNVDDQTHATLRKKNKFKDSVKSSVFFCSFVNVPS